MRNQLSRLLSHLLRTQEDAQAHQDQLRLGDQKHGIGESNTFDANGRDTEIRTSGRGRGTVRDRSDFRRGRRAEQYLPGGTDLLAGDCAMRGQRVSLLPLPRQRQRAHHKPFLHPV